MPQDGDIVYGVCPASGVYSAKVYHKGFWRSYWVCTCGCGTKTPVPHTDD